MLSACARPAAGTRPKPRQVELDGGDNAGYRAAYQEWVYLVTSANDSARAAIAIVQLADNLVMDLTE
jgi:hypothetical protein